MKKKKKEERQIIKILILIILILIVLITSFKSGQKYYDIKNTQLNSRNTNITSNIAKWYFRATIAY